MQEAAIMSLREQASSLQKNCEDLRRQHVEDVSQLKIEREALYRERLSMTAMERDAKDGFLLMEQRYDNVKSECAGLRRLLEEQNHNRDESDPLKCKN